MKRKIKLESYYAPTAAQMLNSQLAFITRARMGEQREDVRDRSFAARFWLQVAKWEERYFGFPRFAASRLFVWTGETYRHPVLP